MNPWPREQCRVEVNILPPERVLTNHAVLHATYSPPSNRHHINTICECSEPAQTRKESSKIHPKVSISLRNVGHSSWLQEPDPPAGSICASPSSLLVFHEHVAVYPDHHVAVSVGLLWVEHPAIISLSLEERHLAHTDAAHSNQASTL